MTENLEQGWVKANQRYLSAALNVVREELEVYQAKMLGISTAENIHVVGSEALLELEAATHAMEAPAALDILAALFGLSAFEKKILLLCAGVELDNRVATLVSSLQGNASLINPTFGLALSVFAEAHWSAVTPIAPLRYWQLLRTDNDQGIARSPLRITENILHYLGGIRYIDEKLNDILTPIQSTWQFLVHSHTIVIKQILEACDILSGSLPVIQLAVGDKEEKKIIAAAVSEEMKCNLYQLYAVNIPSIPKETEELIKVWNRDGALNNCALLLDCTGIETTDKTKVLAITKCIEQLQGLIFVSTAEWKPPYTRRKIEINVPHPTAQEQLQLWKKAIGHNAENLNGLLDKVVAQFDMGAATINKAARETTEKLADLAEVNYTTEVVANTIWQSCCIHTRPATEMLAERIEPIAGWDDLVLPNSQKQVLQDIAVQVKHRYQVYSKWGFAGKSSRGLGISALFAGESGTGKTMASEVLANELKLDLYRIDLSQVVNKYIGETEKNLKKIFDAAEEGGAILLFDEADALFGKRSEVKDSHDRYSNIEVSYLLQRMEAYRGLAILTTNLKNSIDTAFLRRIRFVVQFPYPDAVLRAEIWRKVFPKDTPVKNLDVDKLAKLNVPGGNIRNIALNAAFMAAEEKQPVQMYHLSKAARHEYSKMERPITNAEIGNW